MTVFVVITWGACAWRGPKSEPGHDYPLVFARQEDAKDHANLINSAQHEGTGARWFECEVEDTRAAFNAAEKAQA